MRDERAYLNEKERLITLLSQISARTNQNLLLAFLDEYQLCNLACATAEQLRAFCQKHRVEE